MRNIILGLFTIMIVMTVLIIIISYQEIDTKAEVTAKQNLMLVNQDKGLSNQDMIIHNQNLTNQLLIQILHKMH